MVDLYFNNEKTMRPDLNIWENNPAWFDGSNTGKFRLTWAKGYPIDDRHISLVNMLVNVILNKGIDLDLELDKVLKK